jgi:hypothetical protein
MRLYTCKNGRLTALKECRVCKRSDFKEAKKALAEVRKENVELRRKVKNLMGVIEAGRAF